MRMLGAGNWVFRSRKGTPINPGNALKRYIRPVARKLGIEMGGWHDFRRTLSTRLLKKWPTNVVSEMLGHSMQTTMEIYQHVPSEDFRAPLGEMPSLTKSLRSDATSSDLKGFEPKAGIEPAT
jgi:integrase